SLVIIRIYDVLGNEVTTLVNEEKPAGEYNIEFRIDNLELSSGIYFYRLQAGEYRNTKKMILLK
ncbi:MAG: T9SS type A sorting domain-containing protein, partial [Ignavibacteriaceae bacterium]|nr:T9SS type A sorting domain-containing protein [Ignavibacteriaceae bacterium]